MKFEKLTSPSEIVDYLKKVLSHTGGIKSNNIFLYHYTTVDALCGILKSNALRLGSSKKMNDQYEKYLLEKQCLCNRLYYFCCSTTGDNISLWNMYGKKRGIMIAIPYTYAKDLLDNTEILSKINNTSIIQEAYWTAIAYCSKEETKDGTRAIRCGSVYNYNIENPPQKDLFAGFLKSKGWSNENEVRLSVILSEENEQPYIEVPLPKGFLKECKFYLSPFTPQKDYFTTVNKIHHVSDSIKIENSMYMGEILTTEENDTFETTCNNFGFLKEYGAKKLLSIQSIPQWPENGNHVSDEVSLNFADGLQLVVTSSFADVDTFFDVDEDVVFAIREDSNYEPFCNIGDAKMSTILVDEKPESIQIFFDEISYADKSKSDKTVVFPIGLFIKTRTRTIGICRDVLNAVWLDANYFNADQNLMYSLNSRWEDFEDVDSFIVKRQAKEYISGKIKLIEEKKFC